MPTIDLAPNRAFAIMLSKTEESTVIGDHLDVASEPDDGGNRRADASQGSIGGRPYLGVQFLCCDAYARIYVNRERTAYAGHCPKCLRPVTVRIGPGGTKARFFQAG